MRFPRPTRLSPAAYRRLVVVTLASLVFIMVTGAAVRLTGSGLGCSTWPTCDADSFTPRSASDVHGMVEWVNRLITGAVMLFTLAAVLGARWRRPYRRDLFLLSLGLPAWVFANALVGALVVILDLSPASVIGHFLLSLGAVANAVVLLERAGQEPAGRAAAAGVAAAPAAPAPAVSGPGQAAAASAPVRGSASAGGGGGRGGGVRRRAATPALLGSCRALVAAACVVILTGTVVTGSGPHAGDQRADRLPLAVHSIVRVHGIAMVVFLTLTLWVIRRAQQGDAAPVVVHRLHQLLVVLVAQAAIGYWQYFTGVPVLLVGFHVLGAALVWIAVLRVLLAASAPEPDAALGEYALEPERATMGVW